MKVKRERNQKKKRRRKKVETWSKDSKTTLTTGDHQNPIENIFNTTINTKPNQIIMISVYDRDIKSILFDEKIIQLFCEEKMKQKEIVC